MKLILLLALNIVALSAQAGDLGFRYKAGKCVNAKGQVGLNPSYLGPCGDLSSKTLARADFSGTDFSGAVFTGSDLEDTSFQSAVLTGVSFAKTNLGGADFDSATGSGVDFTSANLVNAHLAASQLTAITLNSANMAGASLSFVSFAGAKMHNVDLSAAILDHADLTAADLTGAKMQQADLHAAVLDRVILDKADLSSANLIKVSLQAAHAVQTRFRRANLRSANVSKADFSASDFAASVVDHSQLDGATFSGTNLVSSDLSQSTYNDTKFNGAKYNRRTKLPFANDMATQLGMVQSSAGSLLIIRDNDAISVDALKATLEAAGNDVTISSQTHDVFDGQIDLSRFTAVLHTLGVEYNSDMPMIGQQAIMNFVLSGGKYIGTQWSGYAVKYEGTLKGIDDLILYGFDDGYGADANYTIATDEKNNPYLEGVQSFVLTGVHTFSALRPFDSNPAKAFLVGDQGLPMAAYRKVGSGISVNFAFAVNDSSSKVLDDANVIRIIQNILEAGP